MSDTETKPAPEKKPDAAEAPKAPKRREFVVAPDRSFFIEDPEHPGVSKKVRAGDVIKLTAAEARPLNRGGFLAPYIGDEDDDE